MVLPMLEVLGFFVGVHLTMTLFGSLYRVIDLAFCLSEFWLEITARISLNIAVILLIYLLFSGDFVNGFTFGQIFFAVFHILIFWLGQLTVLLIRRD
jgi:hypothetical protein